MSKTTLTAAITIAALAGTAMADRPHTILGPMLETSTGDLVATQPGGGSASRNINVVYDFATGALEIRPTSLPPHVISVDPSLAGLHIIGLEAVGIEAEVYWNQGATYENWASEMRLGVRFDNSGVESTLGGQVFPGANTGPAAAGTFQVFTGGAYGPFDLSGDSYYTPASGLSVAGWTTYNDGSGMMSHRVTAGQLHITLVPSPGAGALLALGGVVAFRRRRA